MTKYIHVDQRKIRQNILCPPGYEEPVFLIINPDGKGVPEPAHVIELLGDDGEIVAKMVYRAKLPLPNGVRCFVEVDESRIRVKKEE